MKENLLSPNQQSDFDQYFKDVNNLQLSGRNLKDLKSIESGLKIEGVHFEIIGNQIPVYFASYIDNGQKYALGVPEFDERDRTFMKLNGQQFSALEEP